MRVVFAVILFFSFLMPVEGQNTDSFVRAIDSSRKAMNERLREQQDSFYKLQVKQSLEQNSRNLDRFLADMKEREKKERRQMYIRLGLGVAFLAVLIVGLLRRRKQAAENKANL